jgi:integrase
VHPEQYRLFDLGRIDFSALKKRREHIMAFSMAPNTLLAYASAWKIFRAWCGEAGCDPLPATPETVCNFVIQTLENGLRLETVNVRLKSIAYHHREAQLPSPARHESVLDLLHNAARELKEEPRGKAPLTPEQIRKIVQLECTTPAHIRNRAMLLLAFASGWRRSEVAALNRRDVEFPVGKGMGLWQRSSKTDQKGLGRYVGIHFGAAEATCPIRALEAWLVLRGDWQGPLFTRIGPGGKVVLRKRVDLRGDALYTAIKGYMKKIGEDPTLYAGHSTRSGMVTAASEAGATMAAIKKCTGHKCSKTLERYIRIPTAFASNPLKGVL